MRTLTLEVVRDAVKGSAAALRCRRMEQTLQEAVDGGRIEPSSELVKLVRLIQLEATKEDAVEAR
jgi:hypothetical protein